MLTDHNFTGQHTYTCSSVIYLSVTYSSLKVLHVDVESLQQPEFATLNPADTLSQCKYVQSSNIDPSFLYMYYVHTFPSHCVCSAESDAAACCFSAPVAAQLSSLLFDWQASGHSCLTLIGVHPLPWIPSPTWQLFFPSAAHWDDQRWIFTHCAYKKTKKL